MTVYLRSCESNEGEITSRSTEEGKSYVARRRIQSRATFSSQKVTRAVERGRPRFIEHDSIVAVRSSSNARFIADRLHS